MPVVLSPRKARASELLLQIGAVHANLAEPYTFTSGWKSPVYIDCRKLITRPLVRREIVHLTADLIVSQVGLDAVDVIAGGETAGIPFATALAEYVFKPLVYVRKQPKGFGRGAQIEGEFEPGQRAILVEDLATDGKSKVNFCRAITQAGGQVKDVFAVFFYGVYPDTEKNLAEVGVRLLSLTDWRTTLDVADTLGYFDAEQVKVVREFLAAPEQWSKAHGGV